jgi:hypothetical protein
VVLGGMALVVGQPVGVGVETESPGAYGRGGGSVTKVPIDPEWGGASQGSHGVGR